MSTDGMLIVDIWFLRKKAMQKYKNAKPFTSSFSIDTKHRLIWGLNNRLDYIRPMRRSASMSMLKTWSAALNDRTERIWEFDLSEMHFTRFSGRNAFDLALPKQLSSEYSYAFDLT